VAAGTYTYKAQAYSQTSSGSISFANCILVAYEI